MADAKFYQDFHYPLPLVRRMRLLQQDRAENANPQAAGNREWFSQPRTYDTKQTLKHTLFAIRGTGGRTTQNIIAALHPEDPLFGNFDQMLASGTNRDLWRYIDMPYPGDSGLIQGLLNMGNTATEGTQILIDLIRNTPGKFAMVGLSQGAIVISNVYDEIRYGSLKDRRADFLCGIALGNPRRQVGFTIPGGIDPGVKRGGPPTHGAFASRLLTDCEPGIWWDFVMDNDSAADVDDTPRGDAIAGLFEFFYHNYFGERSIVGEFLQSFVLGPGMVVREIVGLAQMVLDNLFGIGLDMIQGILTLNPDLVQDGHLRYHLPYPGLPGSQLSPIQLGIEHLDRIGRENEFVTINSTTTECLTITFRLPFSVSEISTEILKMPCIVEIWYLDRSNNWRPVLDTSRSPMKIRVDRADTKEWYKWSSKCYPIVAKRVQLRLTRTNDPTLSGTPYPVGVRNTLIKRNVYDRNQGGFFENEIDMMGNIVSKYVRDWDASLAADDNYTTFWKSAPMPDPDAVANLFLDVRSTEGAPQVIDRVYLDPVYTGQQLNLYYSNDDTVGTRTLNPITIPPPDIEGAVSNVAWKFGTGLTDTSEGNSGTCKYSWTLSLGPQSAQDAWIGVEWRPDFGTVSAPNLAANPTLFAAGTNLGSSSPTLFYQAASGSRRFVLDLGGESFETNSISQEWAAGDSIKVVAGWRYSDSSVYIKVVDAKGRTIASHNSISATLPDQVGFDGTASVEDFRGTLTNLILKFEDYGLSTESFLAAPEFYCDPDPVLPDSNDKYPSTSLDNAVYVAPFLSREHGSGNSDRSHYEDKEWTPIWRDYVAVKGMLFFPQPISMKYLKLEFTNLTEQPYPIYESGIETRYKVFPLSVLKQSYWGSKKYTGEGGFLGLGSFISMNGVKSVNFLDPNSVMKAIGGMVGRQIPPIQVTTGIPYLADVLPNNGAVDVQRSLRIETGSSYVYSRDTLQPYVLAEDRYNTIIKAEGLQAIQPFVDIPWKEIEAANPNAVTKVKSLGTTPIRGSDWWIYPGQQLKVPASVMRKLTDTQTVTERKFTLERRVRFNTTSVHRYDIKTLKRDAAVAYFAGVREVQPYIASHISGEDVAVYKFPSYTPEHWTFSPAGAVRQTELGPVTAASASVYGVVSKTMTSQSDFTKVSIDFQDSGLYRSNPMWVDIDEQVDSIPDTQLSPYFQANPDLPQGKWLDPLSTWLDPAISWGSGLSSVQVSIDPDQRFQGRRVVHFVREANAAQQAGITVRQWNNFIPGAQMRVGATFYRPANTSNNLVLQLRRVDDGVVVLRETLPDNVPSGRWFTSNTQFVEIPETATNGSFEAGLAGWMGLGGSWTYVTNKGFTGTHSARLATNGTRSTLTNINKAESLAETTISAAAWITWSNITPGATIYLNALLYGNDGTLIDTVELTDKQVTPATASTSDWFPLSGSTTVPVGEGVTQVGFQVVVPAAAGSGGTVWVDDFTFDVPGSPRQQYVAELNLEGTEKEEMYVSDLFTEITPIRYFVRLGPEGTTPIEVTDLRYTQNVTMVTTTTPVNEMQVQAVIASDRCYAYGCTITPHYLR